MAEEKSQRIDIIIPCYHTHKTLLRTLSSIAAQTIREDLDVILVNDADEKDYSEFVKMWKPYLSIREIKMEKNGGPGDARQYGIDNTKNELITFIDSDDSFSGAFALEVLRKQLLAEPQNIACFSAFVEEHEGQVYNLHQTDNVWMFGKLYKRSFLDKNKIRFLPGSRANEDNGFNCKVELLSNPNEQIKFIQDITYYWHCTNPGSITRRRNCEYSYNASFVGFVHNMIHSIKFAESINPFNPNILMKKVSIFVNLYEYYIETMHRDPRFKEQNWLCCLKFYNEIYKEVEDKINDNILAEVYNGVMRNCYMGNKLFGIIPVLGFKEYIEKLHKDSADGVDTSKVTMENELMTE